MKSDQRLRIYRAEPPDEGFLGKITILLPDRPGSLAWLAGLLSDQGLNITGFRYNRTEDPNRVQAEVVSPDIAPLAAARLELDGRADCDPLEAPLELGIVDEQSMLTLKVRLEHRPGTLGAFARLLGEHGANVIFMAYDEEIARDAVSISLVTKNADEIDRLLKELNQCGYLYTLRYHGAGQEQIEDVIGLNLAERLYFRLKKLLHTDDVDRLRRLVDSSRRMTEMLVGFSREAGRHLDAGEILTHVLAFASASLARTGDRFSWRTLPVLRFGDVAFHAFRIPTGANIFILESGDELVMIDGGYGHYYEDVKRMLRANGLEPARLTRIYISHPDADHVGQSGWFAEEFGCRVRMHAAARAIIASENRVWGSGSELLEINNYFTVLVNELTRFRVPRSWEEYGAQELGRIETFRIIDSFKVGSQTFQVLESLGGHIPAQVFFLGEESGLIFSGDFLLDVGSLSREDREILNLPKRMMTSTNADSLLFRQEMDALGRLALTVDDRLREKGGSATIVPGHGDWYSAERLRNLPPEGQG